MNKAQTQTLTNVLTALMKIVSEITDHIDDEELSAKVKAILFATSVEQDMINMIDKERE